MIQNERQRKVTKGQIDRLNNAISAARALKKGMAPRVYQAMIAGLESQLEDLQQELKAYDKIKKAKVLHLDSIEDLAKILIMSRVALGYSQQDLAKKLKVKPQQIQRYEAPQYRSARLQRILDIAKILQINLHANIILRKDSPEEKRPSLGR